MTSGISISRLEIRQERISRFYLLLSGPLHSKVLISFSSAYCHATSRLTNTHWNFGSLLMQKYLNFINCTLKVEIKQGLTLTSFIFMHGTSKSFVFFFKVDKWSIGLGCERSCFDWLDTSMWITNKSNNISFQESIHTIIVRNSHMRSAPVVAAVDNSDRIFQNT